MDSKIQIEIISREIGGITYKVTQGDKFAEGLTFDEMLGLVASLTIPEKKPCIFWMRTQADRDEEDRRLRLASDDGDIHPDSTVLFINI